MFALQVVGQRPAKERRLEIVPVTQKEAHAFADRRYKQQKRIKGYQFSVGCTDGDRMVGVANVARPASRYMDDGWTLEMTGVCTDGSEDVRLMLYAAAWRAARALGYRKLITYVMDTEPGTGLKMAGWKCIGQVG